MAVTLFSKIKIRRGKKDELVDLDKSELGFVTDTGEVLIGAPDFPPLQGMGKGETNEQYPYKNIRLLTNSSNQTKHITYTYMGNGINIAQTGSTLNDPVLRNIQERLDDLVFFDDFISDKNINIEKSADLNRMLRQVYDNSDQRARKICHISAGLYNIENSIKLPPYTHLKGEGIDKTFLNFRTTTSQTHMFETVDRLFQEGLNISTNGGGVPNNIIISDMTIAIDQLMDFFRIYRANNIKFIRVKFKGAGAVSSTSCVFNLDRLGVIVDMSNFHIENCIFEDVSKVFNDLVIPANIITDITIKNSSFNFFYNIINVNNVNIKNITLEGNTFKNAQGSPFVLGNGSNFSSSNNRYLLDNLVQPTYVYVINAAFNRFSSINDENTAPLKYNNSSQSSIILNKNNDEFLFKRASYSNVISKPIADNQTDLALDVMFALDRYETVFVDYSVKLNGSIRTGRLTLTHNMITPTIFDNYNETTASDIIFSLALVPVNGKNHMSLLYTSGTKSGTITLTYIGHGK